MERLPGEGLHFSGHLLPLCKVPARPDLSRHTTPDPTTMPKTKQLTALLDRKMIRRCHELARRAAEAGSSAVGSLVAENGAILGEAEEATPAGPVAFAHAELLAVQRALAATGQRRLPRATLYSTHEPCFLCSYALRAAHFGRIVLAKAVPEIGGATSRYPILLAEDIGAWGPAPEVVWTESSA